MLMTSISIVVPESLSKQKRELESTLNTILADEEKLVTKRKEIQAALALIASSVAILSSELVPTAVRKPMSDDAKLRIGEGLRKAREAKAQAAQVVALAPQAPAPAPADVPVADTPGKREVLGKGRGRDITPRQGLLHNGAVAELERNLIIERVRAGMRRARIEGHHIGRNPLVLDSTGIQRDRCQGQSLRQIAKGHRISTATVQRVLRECPAQPLDKIA
jgi:hypothetical protein